MRSPPDQSGNRAVTADPKFSVLVSVLLFLATLAVYWPALHFPFINYDDPAYVTENPQVRAGLTRQAIGWAFGRLAGESTYWHPLTWLSHMLDCQWFGLKPRPHHLVNVLFHAANGVLLFLALQKMTGAGWRSAMVAALFLWHPLQVDTVAWIAERKNVLSTCLWLLTILAYLRYVRAPKAGRLALVLGCFALGLMAKPMLVTVPLVLLLLDFWPLHRLRIALGPSPPTLGAVATLPPISLFRALLEKLPLFALSAASAAITIAGHHRLGALTSPDVIPLDARVGNAVVSYVRYLGKIIWPSDLAVYYPHPGSWSWGWVTAAGLVLVGVSAGTVWNARRRPYLLAGWLWFLVTLLPVIGLVQAGSQAMADRFAYVPLVGIFIALVWGAYDWVRDRALCYRVFLGCAAVSALAACLLVTQRQLDYWKSSESLFAHALAVTRENYIAHENLAVELAKQGELMAARQHLEAALRIKPAKATVHFNLGLLCSLEGKPVEALAQYRRAVALRPTYAKALNNLAWMLATHPQAKCRDGPEAVQLAGRAAALTRYQDPAMLDTLAAACAEANRFSEAVQTAELARGIATAAGRNELARQIAARLKSYQGHQPWREP